MTLHTWAGVGIGSGSVEQLVKKIKKSKASALREEGKTLVIDEVSMLDAGLEKLGEGNEPGVCPFGGIQLVSIGDFFQLPPVDGVYVFQTDLKELDIKTKVLTEVFRQRDSKFAKI